MTDDIPKWLRAKFAEAHEEERIRKERWESMTEEERQKKFKDNVDMLRASEEFEGFD